MARKRITNGIYHCAGCQAKWKEEEVEVGLPDCMVCGNSVRVRQIDSAKGWKEVEPKKGKRTVAKKDNDKPEAPRTPRSPRAARMKTAQYVVLSRDGSYETFKDVKELEARANTIEPSDQLFKLGKELKKVVKFV